METTPLKTVVTPEMWKQGIRLADIMMPHVMRQTRGLFQREPGQTHGRVVHYTTAEAALNIIRTKRFWMRNTNCMSDYKEVQHGFDIFNSFFSSYPWPIYSAFVDELTETGVANSADRVRISGIPIRF